MAAMPSPAGRTRPAARVEHAPRQHSPGPGQRGRLLVVSLTLVLVAALVPRAVTDADDGLPFADDGLPFADDLSWFGSPEDTGTQTETQPPADAAITSDLDGDLDGGDASGTAGAAASPTSGEDPQETPASPVVAQNRIGIEPAAPIGQEHGEVTPPAPDTQPAGSDSAETGDDVPVYKPPKAADIPREAAPYTGTVEVLFLNANRIATTLESIRPGTGVGLVVERLAETVAANQAAARLAAGTGDIQGARDAMNSAARTLQTLIEHARSFSRTGLATRAEAEELTRAIETADAAIAMAAETERQGGPPP
jgi:hypothetical protein